MANTTFARITFEQRKLLENLKVSLGLKNEREAIDFIIKENARLEQENKVFKDLEKSRELQKLRK